MAIIFGTDGWRGLLGEDINDNSVSVVAQAFADYLNSNFSSPKVVLGYDNRLYSKEFVDIFASVLSGNDIISYVSDKIIPTPIVSFNVKLRECSAGVMITASHNPAEYNGIKFKSQYGAPFFTEQTREVEQLLFKSKVKTSQDNIFYVDLFFDYLNRIKNLIDFDIIKEANLKILVDSMGGAGQMVIEELLKGYCNVETIYGMADKKFFGRYAEPIEKNLIPLSDKLKENDDFAFGVANDGDADRVGVVLDTGTWLSAQDTILLIADYLFNVKKIEGDS